MRKRAVSGIFGLLLACSSGVGGALASAATPSFTISATNVTMPAAGNGSIPFTLTSVNGYSGIIGFTCTAMNRLAEARLPTCIGSTNISLAGNQTADSECVLIPPGGVIPPSTADLLHSPNRRGLGVALAGALLLAFRIRQRTRWLALTLFAMGTIAGVAGISSCGGNGNPMTPGTYTYAITGTDTTGMLQNATAQVTIP